MLTAAVVMYLIEADTKRNVGSDGFRDQRAVDERSVPPTGRLFGPHDLEATPRHDGHGSIFVNSQCPA